MLTGIRVEFRNRPTEDGGLETFTIDDCLVANSGSGIAPRPEILIHLPKNSAKVVDGSFVTWDNEEYHVIGTTAKQMDGNTPTRWNRYAIAERIRML